MRNVAKVTATAMPNVVAAWALPGSTERAVTSAPEVKAAGR